MSEREAVIWCPSCREDKYEIQRRPTGFEGVHEHVTVPPNLTAAQRKYCVCGTTLTRKELVA